MKIKTIFLSLLIFYSGIILSDFNDGLDAYNQGDYDIAFEEWLPYAEQGDADAQYNLALVYDFGYKDYDQAFKWYRRSALQGNEDAQYNLALMYENGKGVLKDYKEAVKWYRKAANQGYAKAQVNLGLMYSKGYGVEVNKYEAVKWYKKSAEQGDFTAQNNLAVMYEYGTGVLKNYKQSINWYLKAIKGDYEKAQENLNDLLLKMNGGSEPLYNEAVKEYNKSLYRKVFPQFLWLALDGNFKAQTYLGVMYAKGQWIEKNYKQSVWWYQKAAEQDYAVAQYNLAVKYDTGKGVPQDYKQAVKWYRKAADQDHAKAQYNLALMYRHGKGVLKDYKEAVKWYRKAADQGLAHAQTNLGWMYENGKGALKDYKEAVKWYRKAADQGHTSAQYNLGVMYKHGEGVLKDYKQAVKWYRKAADQGHTKAQYNLALMYEHGEGVLKDYKQAVKWYRKAAAQGDEKAKSRLEKLLVAQGGENNKYTVFSSNGTGFVVSKDGVVATNYHVVDNCGRIVVDEKDATLILQDKVNDLALIKIDKTYDKVSHLSYRSPTLGSDVSVFGYPLSDMMSEKYISLTKGSVSSLAGMDGNLSNFRFTAPIQPGNSGGPIVNKKGKVVGITRAVLGKTVLEKGDFLPQNVNFGIRSSLLINMMESKMIPVYDTPLQAEDIVKHYVKTTKYIKCYE
jgi:TPR repeat protein